jgi:hypothetical protein
MNERIRLLSEQAHRSTADELAHLQRVHNRTYDLNESAAIYNEKFAELIIRECFQACMNEGASYEEKAAGAYQSNLYVTAIKKHFGVEE